MKRLVIAVLTLALLAAALWPATRPVTAASPWAGTWKSPYVHGDPTMFARLQIAGSGRRFLVALTDNIPADAWDDGACGGPSDAWGFGSLVNATEMRVTLIWRCRSDGSIRLATDFLRLNTGGTIDSIAFCTGPDFSTCGLVLSRQ